MSQTRYRPMMQSHLATRWLERQTQKLIPTEYFMITITLPEQLRALAFQHQHRIYAILFEQGIAAVKQLGFNLRHLGGEIGLTAVLHTHTRKLDYHPHLHIIIPAAAWIQQGKAFQRLDSKYLIHGDVIAKLFRGKFLYALYEEGFEVPRHLPEHWVVNVKHIGKGLPALQYLSRYLYRGVITANNIIHADERDVSFKYKNSETQQTETRALPGEDFIWKLLIHILPRGFRRVRDYGFLHHNAKKKLTFIQYLLGVKIMEAAKPKPVIHCHNCLKPTTIVHIQPLRIPINYRFTRSAVARE